MRCVDDRRIHIIENIYIQQHVKDQLWSDNQSWISFTLARCFGSCSPLCANAKAQRHSTCFIYDRSTLNRKDWKNIFFFFTKVRSYLLFSEQENGSECWIYCVKSVYNNENSNWSSMDVWRIFLPQLVNGFGNEIDVGTQQQQQERNVSNRNRSLSPLPTLGIHYSNLRVSCLISFFISFSTITAAAIICTTVHPRSLSCEMEKCNEKRKNVETVKSLWSYSAYTRLRTTGEVNITESFETRFNFPS